MTAGERIPDSDHVARYCKPTTITEYGDISASAFLLRENEINLSVNWLEILNSANLDEAISVLRRAYITRSYTLQKKAKFALLNVGEACEKVRKDSSDGRIIDFLHDPLALDPSHSEIHNLSPDNELIAELIVEIIKEIYPAHTTPIP